MRTYRCSYTCACLLAALTMLLPAAAHAATIYVAAGGNLQAAINAADPGDTILLEPGATFVGTFTLPVHGGTSYITIRSAADDELLPSASTRMSPEYAQHLPKIRSSTTMAALSVKPGAAYWRLMLLEFQANVKGQGDIVRLGESSSTTLDQVPHHLYLDRLYIWGDPVHGQKRGIALNSSDTVIVNSHISGMRAVNQDSQAIAGWNGPGRYRIENNYLEAAGEVFMLGGSDPAIVGLTPSDVVFSRNLLTRPLSWREPIIPAPANVRPSAAGGGALPAGTYAYRVVARRVVGTELSRSAATAEVAVTAPAGASITLSWDAVPGASEYLVYGRTPGAHNQYWKVSATSFVDTGAPGAAGTPSSQGTVWQVKNLLELKHARNVLIEHNVMTNNWAQAQNGTAILISPRNQNGACTWCVVEQVTLQYNVVRHVGAGIKISGYDDERQSLQTNNIVVRHNEFSDVSRQTWGGLGYVVVLLSGARAVTIDHNTLIAPDGPGLVTVDNAPMEAFVFTNNVGRHNTYGVKGTNMASGNGTIAYYFPGGDIRRNVIAGAKASSYPADNLFPTVADFEAHFSDYAGGDFTLVPGSDWAGAGTDGRDLGADLRGGGRDADSGVTVPPVVLVTSALPDGTVRAPYGYALQAEGGLGAFVWRLSAGMLPAGLALSTAGVITGEPAGAGTSLFEITVADAGDPSRFSARTLSLVIAPPPNRAPAVSLAPISGPVPVGATVVFDAEAWDADGTVTRVDFLVGGLPAGSAAGPDFVMPWVVPTSGVFTVTAVAWDDVNTPAASLPIEVAARSEVVIYASDVVRMEGEYQLVADATAAEGYRLANRDQYQARIETAVADPSTYAEFTFYAEAGRPYQLWMRGKAQRNHYTNDSVHVQFDGVEYAQIGTTGSVIVNLEEDGGAGILEWGWQDTGYGWGVLGEPITFVTTGLQRVRIQPREDGLSIDQIVLSPERYFAMSPGTLKQDATIVAR